MNAAASADDRVANVAAAIGETARARMLCCLLDNRARTATELALTADVSPSTASVHLSRLKSARLVKVFAQGRHRYFSLANTHVAAALEALSVLAGRPVDSFAPNTPNALRAARTCYDHLAGALGVALHDRLVALGFLAPVAGSSYELTPKAEKSLTSLGIDIAAARVQRRRLAFACLDWSERRPHLGGAIAAELLAVAVARRWIAHGRASRLVRVTTLGRRELMRHFGLRVPDDD